MPNPLLKGFPKLLADPLLANAEWRRGRYGIPVLVHLPEHYHEWGDRHARLLEPDPLGAELRALIQRTRDTGLAPESEWWEHGYPGGPGLDVQFVRALLPPSAAKKGKTPSTNGPDVQGAKRTVSRAGRHPWQPFDQAYSNGFAAGTSGNVGKTGMAGVQRQQSISPAYGWMGEPTFNTLRCILIPPPLPHAGEYAMDATAIHLFEQAYQIAHAPKGTTDDVKKAITDYCVGTLKAATVWHYEQYRAMRTLGVAPTAGGYNDCSEHATCTYYWAKTQTGIAVPDPNGTGYNGYGYTGTLVNNPKVSAPYQIGDMGIYGTSTSNTTHVVTCYVAGDASSAEWCSNGSESAPYAVQLHYRDDLVAVVRPGLMP